MRTDRPDPRHRSGLREALLLLTLIAVGAPATAQEIRRIQLPVGDFVFDARASGPTDGPLVLLLHGFPETSHMWRHQLRALGEAGYHAVAPDQRGYSPGARPEAVAAYNTTALTNDVAAFADALGYDRFHVVGHDWGGAVAWITATRFPARISSLTVLSTPHPTALGAARASPDSDQAQRSSYFVEFATPGTEHSFLANDHARMRELYSGFAPDVVREYIRVLGTPEAMRAALAWYRAAFGGTTPAAGPAAPMPPIRAPTLFIWSTEDTFLGRDAAEATEQYVAGPYRFEVLEGVDHWITERRPEYVSRQLLEHLAANRSTP